MLGLSAALALVAAACGGPRPVGGAATVSAAHPASQRAEAVVVATLQAAQRAGYERHDLPAYMAQWAPDATLTAARGPKPSPFDRTLDRATIYATRAERFFRPPTDGRTLRWRDVRVRVTPGAADSGAPADPTRRADHATVAWRAVTRHGDGAEEVAEVYELRRTGRGWQVVRNRFWPLWTQESGKKVRYYTPATWRKLDAWATRTPCFGGRCPSRLLSAWRFEEAWQEAKRMSQRPGGATAHAWLLRGICAVLSGHVSDARPSFVRARLLDPKLPLPPWRSATSATRSRLSPSPTSP